MNISALVQPGTQERFLPEEDVPLTSNAQRRVEVGNFFEEATKVVFGAARHQTVAGKYCPDLSLGPKRFLEVKAIGRSLELIVFRKRLERDKEMCQTEKAKLIYVLWHYFSSPLLVAPVFSSTSRFQLREVLADSIQSVTFVSFDTLYQHCEIAAPAMLEYRPGKPPEECYRIRRKTLREWSSGQQRGSFGGHYVFGRLLPTVAVCGFLEAMA